MECFSVNIYLRIITTSEEDGKILVFLDETGEFPKISLASNTHLDTQIREKLFEYFYDNDIFLINSTKQVSTITNNSNNNLDIVYNFITSNTASKKGSFIYFNKNSIELYRMINNNKI